MDKKFYIDANGIHPPKNMPPPPAPPLPPTTPLVAGDINTWVIMHDFQTEQNQTKQKCCANKYMSRETVWRNLTFNTNKNSKIDKKKVIQSTLVISNFTGPDKNVRVISSSRQPNCDVIGMTTVCLSAWKEHVYGNLNNLRVLQFALLLCFLGNAMVLLE